MGRMKDMLIEQMELSEAILRCDDFDKTLDVPTERGWLTPTERRVALVSLEQGDVQRALEILRTVPNLSEKAPA